MTCTLDFLSFDYDASIANGEASFSVGGNGLLTEEFGEMEKYAHHAATTNNVNKYWCDLSIRPSLQCLDIGAVSTLSNSLDLQAFDTSVFSDDQLIFKYIQNSNSSSINLFGQSDQCLSKRVGDGVVNVFDIATLISYLFSDSGYSQLGRDPQNIQTVEGRDNLEDKCLETISRGQYLTDYSTDVCLYMSSQSPSGRRLLSSSADEYRKWWSEQTLQDFIPRTTVTHSNDSRMLLTAPNYVKDYTVPSLNFSFVVGHAYDIGSWRTLTVDTIALRLEVVFSNMTKEDETTLSNEQFDGTVPKDPTIRYVKFTRYCEYKETCNAMNCAAIETAFAYNTAMKDNTLNLIQRPISDACAYEIHIWVPGLQHVEIDYIIAADGNQGKFASRYSISPLPPTSPSPPLSPPFSPAPLSPPLSPQPPSVPGPYGCTFSNGLNYKPFAEFDDGTCIIGGCTDSMISSFNSLATYDDGSCHLKVAGCTDSTANNYRSLANIDDETCIYTGCMSTDALNYNQKANVASFCIKAIFGCTNPNANNYFISANTDDSSCVSVGCTDSSRLNFDETANLDSGTCTPLFSGCTNPLAGNYKSFYTNDDGSCSVGGCNIEGNANYKSDATFNDGTCARRRLNIIAENEKVTKDTTRRRLSSGCIDPVAANYDESASAHDSDLCEYDILGCTDSFAFNYLSAATVERAPSECLYPIYGCTVELDTLNYDSTAEIYSDCIYSKFGCTDSNSINFISEANEDDGSCTYPIVGCNSPTAINFDSFASVMGDDSCVYPIVGCADISARNFASDVNTPCDECCTYTILGCMSQDAVNFDSTANFDDGTCIVLSPPPSPPPPLQPAPPSTPTYLSPHLPPPPLPVPYFPPSSPPSPLFSPPPSLLPPSLLPFVPPPSPPSSLLSTSPPSPLPRTPLHSPSVAPLPLLESPPSTFIIILTLLSILYFAFKLRYLWHSAKIDKPTFIRPRSGASSTNDIDDIRKANTRHTDEHHSTQLRC